MRVSLGAEGVREAGPVQDGTCARQSFRARAARLRSVSVCLFVRETPHQELLQLEVLDYVTRRSVARCGLSGGSAGAGWCEFPLEAGLDPGRKYDMVLSTVNARAGMSPVAYCGRASGEGELFMGSAQERGFELTCDMEYQD